MKRSTWLVLALAMVWTVVAIYLYTNNRPGPRATGELRYPLSRIKPGTNLVNLEPLGINDWKTTVYEDGKKQAWPLRNVYIVKTGEDDILVLGGVDPDLGCNIVWDEPAQVFLNPCHAQRYSQDGTKLSGPGGHDRMTILASRISGTDLLISASPKPRP